MLSPRSIPLWLRRAIPRVDAPCVSMITSLIAQRFTKSELLLAGSHAHLIAERTIC